jgi:hypothetical protein
MSYGIETHGHALVNVLLGLRPGETGIATRLLAEHGLSVAWEDGRALVDDWYPVHQVLAVLRRLGDELGDDVLMRIGESVGRFTKPNATSLREALRGIDVAYHMAHRKNGTLMFDAENGMLDEGIGCFVCTDDASGLLVDSATLYPCSFDLGIISAITRRFEPDAEVAHLDNARCRRRGAVMCSYSVRW